MVCAVIQHFLKKSQLIVVFVLKKSIQPLKNWSFAWKKLSFLTQKDLPASQKTEILHDKMTKKSTKKFPKRASSPAKSEVLQKKKCLFYSKRPPSPAKNSSFAWKNDKKLTKKMTQKSRYQLKNTEVLNEKLKTVLQMGILKKKISTPNFTKLLNP